MYNKVSSKRKKLNLCVEKKNSRKGFHIVDIEHLGPFASYTEKQIYSFPTFR